MNVFDLFAKLSLDSSAYDQGLENAKDKASGLGNGLKTAAKVGAAAIGAATTAIVAFAGDSVETGKAFDKSMAQVAATMGVSVDEVQDLRDYALEMGSATAFSASQAADALNFMALAGYDAETSMDMLPNVLNLAAAGGLGLADASDMVTDASSALGLSIEETAKLVDQMAQASSKSNTSVGQLGSAILTVGGTAKSLAGGTNELATALGILADNGIKGAEGGTALRNIILAMTPTTDGAVAAFNRLGLTAYDADGNLRPLGDTFSDLSVALSTMSSKERTEILNDIFNKVDLKSANALLAATGDEMAEISTALDETGVSWDEYLAKVIERTGDTSLVAADLTNDIAASVRGMAQAGMSTEEQIKVLQDEWGLTAEDAASAVQAANSAIENHSDRWDELSASIADADGAAQKMADTQLDNLAGDITLFQSALEGAKIAVSDSLTPSLREFVQFGTDGISQLTAAFQEGGLQGAADAFGGILAEGLTMIIDMLPEAVEAGTTLVMSLAEGLLSNVGQITEAGMEILTALVGGIGAALPTLIPLAVQAVLDFAQAIIDNAPALLAAGVEFINGIVQGVQASIPLILEALPQIIESLTMFFTESAPQLIQAGVTLLSGLIDSLPQVISAVVAALPGLVSAIVEGIVSNISTMVEAGVQLFTALVQALPEGIAAIVNALPGLISGIVDGLLQGLPTLIEAGVELLGALVDGLPEVIGVIVDALPALITAIVEALLTALPELINAGITLFVALIEALPQIIETIVNALPQLINGIIDALIASLPAFIDAGVKLFVAIIENLPKIIKEIVAKIPEIIDAILNAFASIGQKMWVVGENIVNGIWQGIQNLASWLWDQVVGFVDNIVSSVKSFLGIASPSKVFAEIGENMALGLGEGFVDTMQYVKKDMLESLDFIDEIPMIPTVPTASAIKGINNASLSNAVTINVYASEGQDEKRVAEEVDRRLWRRLNGKDMVYA